MTFMIGCDPELFVRNDSGFVTAHGLIPGDKKAPHKVERGAIQVDGMAVEFNIDPVDYRDFEAFNNNIVDVLGQLKKALPTGHKIQCLPTVVFDKDYYDNVVPEDAKELGCDPDFCAYSADPFEPNPRPDSATSLRSAAGHIHIGWGADIPTDNIDHLEICRSFVKNLDVFVGLTMTLIDDDGERRKLYGRAGAYRPKSYGVEYRTPSNKWLRSVGSRRFIHSMVTRAIEDMKRGSKAACFKYGEGGIAAIINSGDVKAAEEVLASLSINLPNGLRAKA